MNLSPRPALLATERAMPSHASGLFVVGCGSLSRAANPGFVIVRGVFYCDLAMAARHNFLTP